MNNTNAHKPGYKHTPLGWIPEEWELKRLGDIGTFSKGKGITKEQLSATGIPCIRYGEIYTTHDYVIRELKSHISEDVASESKEISSGDLLLAGSGETIEEIGKAVVYVGNKKAYAGGDIIILSPFKGINSVALSYTMETSNVKRQKRVLGQGNSVVHIYASDLSNVLVPIPPQEQQQKIATILSTWDEAIQKTQQLIEQLKQRNKGLMQQLLKPRPEWKLFKLSDIFDRVTKKNTEGNKNVVTISAQRGFVRQDDFFNKLVASDTLDNYFLVERGDFCYNKSYSKGYDWGATKRLKDFDKAVVTTLYICFRLKKTANHSGDFFEYFFESGILDKGLSKVAHEGGRAHGLLNVTPDDFFSLKVSLPDKTEQDRIFSVLRVADAELNLYQQQLTTLQEQKKGLMQKLLSGEVRVK